MGSRHGAGRKRTALSESDKGTTERERVDWRGFEGIGWVKGIPRAYRVCRRVRSMYVGGRRKWREVAEGHGQADVEGSMEEAGPPGNAHAFALTFERRWWRAATSSGNDRGAIYSVRGGAVWQPRKRLAMSFCSSAPAW